MAYMMINVTFDNHLSYDDWGLMLEYIDISFPVPRQNKVTVPGTDGVLDLSEIISPVIYDEREVRFVFSLAGGYEDWHKKSSDIANAIHGRRVKIILDTDRNYYYIGRATLESTNVDDAIENVVITGQVDPFKYELNDGSDPWLWDHFSFKDGIIRNYSDISVTGSTNVRIIGRRKRSIPTITCSAQMVLTYKQTTIHLPVGKTKVYELQLGEGEHILTFTGTGTISISYQGGSL